MHVGTASHQPLTHAPTAPAVGSHRVPSGSQLDSLESKAYICCVQLLPFELAHRMMHGWSPKMGQADVSTTWSDERPEQAVEVSWHAPFWQKPLLDAPHRVVVGAYWQRPSQHPSPPLHSAPAMRRQPVQHAEVSSHSSPVSTTPLPQLGEVATHCEAPSHAPAPPPSAVHTVEAGMAPYDQHCGVASTHR